jgi:hypothetical protein
LSSDVTEYLLLVIFIQTLFFSLSFSFFSYLFFYRRPSNTTIPRSMQHES